MRLAERYFTDLRAVARTDLDYRTRTVKRMLGTGSDIAYRNRGLYDAWRLLRSEWTDDPQWEFTRLRDLPADQPLPDEVPTELQEQIARALKQAIAETPGSFEELQSQRPDLSDTGTYMEWFYRYVPYLTLGLAPDATGLASARARLRWFLEPLPEDEEILRDAVLRRGQRYIDDWCDFATLAP
jgi:hypothetical protein